jgi:hypothetical protein
MARTLILQECGGELGRIRTMRKLLFLDVDGVVNSEGTMKRQYARLGRSSTLGIDPYLAFLVGKIQLDTGCEVVLSSAWRLWENSRQEVREQVVDFIDVTPSLSGIYTRGREIQQWLRDNNAEDACYAILDDDIADMLVYQAPNIFKTTFKEGLTPEIAKAVTEHLNK